MSAGIKAWIDEHRAIHAAATQYPNVVLQSPTWIEAMKARGEYERDARVNFPTALSMIEAVLELHKPSVRWCGQCEDEWPCETVRALKGVIDGE